MKTINKFIYGKKSKYILETVNRYLRLCAFRTISKSLMVDISVPEWGGLRTDKYQNKLYQKKWSKADGYNNKSDHQIKDNEDKSKALDLCAYSDGKQNWDKPKLIYIAMI